MSRLLMRDLTLHFLSLSLGGTKAEAISSWAELGLPDQIDALVALLPSRRLQDCKRFPRECLGLLALAVTKLLG
jgi:hypothetical protein